MKIISNCHFDVYNFDNIEFYFYSEFKKAGRDEFIEPDIFLNGCRNSIKELESRIWVNRRNHEARLKDTLEKAKNGTLAVGKLKKGKTIQMVRNEIIELCESQIANLKPDEEFFTLNDDERKTNTNNEAEGRIPDLNQYAIDIIKIGLLKAYLKAKNEFYAVQDKKEQELYKINYAEVVWEGYLHENSGESMKDYFISKFKKIPKKNLFGFNEFFDGLYRGVDRIEKEIKSLITRREIELLEKLRDLRFQRESSNPGLEEQKINEDIVYINSDLVQMNYSPDEGELVLVLPSDGNKVNEIPFKGFSWIRSQIEEAKNSVSDMGTLSELINSTNPTVESYTGEENDLLQKSITFNGPDTIEKIQDRLKGYFPKEENELFKALKGEKLDVPLYFPHNQNKLVELFKRMKYNGLLLSNYSEITNWLCENFTFRYQKGQNIEIRPFNRNTVRDILKNHQKEPKPIERICKNDEFIPYKTPSKR